jgi:hypothetical protein
MCIATRPISDPCDVLRHPGQRRLLPRLLPPSRVDGCFPVPRTRLTHFLVQGLSSALMKRLLALDRRILIGVPIAALVLLLIGFGIGRLTATDSTASASGTENAASGSENPGSATPDSSQGDDPDAPPSTITGDAAAALPPASDTPEEGIPVYGTEAEREALLMGLIESEFFDDSGA